jgi:hypothetical protein
MYLTYFRSRYINEFTPAPKYVVDLDKPPADRWTHIISAYQQQIKWVEAEINQSIKESAGKVCANRFLGG